jgi:hypothetical protein
MLDLQTARVDRYRADSAEHLSTGLNRQENVTHENKKVKKGKAIPVTGRGGSQGCERFRLQIF